MSWTSHTIFRKDLNNHMNDIARRQIVRSATEDKFRDKSAIESKQKPLYPMTVEREYRRVTDAYMREYKKCLMESLPELRSAYKAYTDDGIRTDGIEDLLPAVNRIFMNIAKKLEQRMARFPLLGRIRKVSALEQRLAKQEWKKLVRSTLGVDLFDDYYNGEFYGDTIPMWVDENVSLIKSLPNDSLFRMRDIMVKDFKAGLTVNEIAKDIQKQYDVDKHDAQLLARDQLATLNGQITEHQQTDAGIKKYKWRTTGDGRVRDCHKALDGKIFSWNDPPEMWYDTKHGRVYTGRRCHPGRDYYCRCVAIPVFEKDTLDLPIKSDDRQENPYGN